MRNIATFVIGLITLIICIPLTPILRIMENNGYPVRIDIRHIHVVFCHAFSNQYLYCIDVYKY